MSRKDPSLYDFCQERNMPDLIDQWNQQKNGELTPRDVAKGSHKKVWWVCEKGHEWQAQIRTRVNGTGCPVCTHRTLVPGVNDFATTHPELLEQWHPTRNQDIDPHKIFAGNCSLKAWWICKEGHEWQATISSRRTLGCPYCAGQRALPGYNDLASQRPALVEEWHPSRNGALTPDTVAVSSNSKVWWICKKGHEWQAVVNLRSHGTGCPYCTGVKVLAGFNDLATIHPALANQWHPELNGDLTPQMMTAGSTKKAWWLCSEGHVWYARIASRTGPVKSGCPICAGNVNKKKLARYQEMLAETERKIARRAPQNPRELNDDT